MDAKLLLRDKVTSGDYTIERVVWELPSPTPERPHGLKYRLYLGRGGECLARYDNVAGKGDHKHLGGVEHPYCFVSLTQLLLDFDAEVRRLTR